MHKLFPSEADAEKKTEKEHGESADKKALDKAGKGISVNGIDDLMVRYGKCCNPVPGDSIRGFITRGRGVTVHTSECPFLIGADPERIIDVEWDVASRHLARVPIEVICEDTKGILADISSAISIAETNIINARVRTTPEKKAINILKTSSSAPSSARISSRSCWPFPESRNRNGPLCRLETF